MSQRPSNDLIVPDYTTRLHKMTRIALSQATDTPARHERLATALLTVLYDRSRDSKQAQALGQDYICYRYDATRLAFCICDGVSQSFYGDLSARFLGDHLVAWLFAATPDASDGATFAEQLHAELQRAVPAATQLVLEHPIGWAVPPIVRTALERKREQGSESMFVAGLVDFAKGQLWAAWMGDLRLWLWDADGQPMAFPDAVWETKERWSSRVGAKNGLPHGLHLPLSAFTRLTIHSDGIGSRHADLAHITLDALDQLAAELSAAPASDDLSIFDLDLHPAQLDQPLLPAPSVQQPDPLEPVLTWAAIPSAAWYRVYAVVGTHQWIVDTSQPTVFLTADQLLHAGSDRLVCQVQAWSLVGAAGLRSEGFAVQRMAVVEPTSTAESEAVIPLTPRASVVTSVRPFRDTVIYALALALALVLALGWIILYA